MAAAITRTIYRPSGRIGWVQMPIVFVAAWAGCAVVSTAYFLVLSAGIYVFVGGAILPTALLACVAYLGVRWSHCRNPRLAVALGLLLGPIGYLGYYHLDQSLRHGVPWYRIDRVPSYVLFRLETDAWSQGKGSALEPQPAAANVTPRPQLTAVPPLANLADFGIQLLLLTCVPALVGLVAARQPYSEVSQQWCRQLTLDLARTAGDRLMAAIDADAIVAWAEAGPRKSVGNEPGRRITLWYVPRRKATAIDATCFLQVDDGPIYGLRAEEAAALVGVVPTIQEIAGMDVERLVAEEVNGGSQHSARVWAVRPEELFGGTLVQNLLRNAAILTLAFGLPLRLLGGAMLCIGVAACAADPTVQTWCAVLFCPLFLAGLVLWVRSMRDDSTWPVDQANHVEAWFFRRAVSRRLEPIVAGNDAQAIYARIVPRKHWEDEFSTGSGIDPGLLRIDEEQRAICFEGRTHRYFLPANVIIDCTLENPPEYPTTTSQWMVVVQLQLGSDLAEFPLLPLAGLEGVNPWERAVALLGRLERLCQRTFSQSLSGDSTRQPAESA